MEEDDKIVEKTACRCSAKLFSKSNTFMHRFSEKGKTAPHCSLQLVLWGPRGEKQVPKLERIVVVKRWGDCEDIQRTDSEILLLAAAGSTIFKIFSRCVFTVYSSFDDNPF